MLLDKNIFEMWMRRLMERLDSLERRINNEKPEKSDYTVDGEKLFDNQDLCFLLNCSKRTLQRYRVAGLLPHKRIRQKTYYLENDVMRFIHDHLQIPKKKQKKSDDTTPDIPPIQ